MRSTRRTRRLLGSGMVWSVLVAAVWTFSGQAQAVDPSPPVAADDHLVITPLTYEAEVDVLDNDSDPAGDALQVCRVDAPDDAGLGVHIWSHDGWPGMNVIGPASTYLTVEPRTTLHTGSYPVTYYACNSHLLTPATLTVEVRRITARAVDGEPGVVRFSNPLDEPIDVLYGPWRGRQATGAFTLAAHASKDRTVRHESIAWAAFRTADEDGDDPYPVGYGVVRHTGAAPSRGVVGARDVAARLAPRFEGLAERFLTRPPRPEGAQPGLDPSAGADTRSATTALDNQAPVTAPDHVTLDYYDVEHVHVLANDTDDSAGDLGICWIDIPADTDLSAVLEPWWADSDRARSDDPDRYVDLDAESAAAGTYELTYYACDRQYLTPGTLTVTVRAFPPPTVRRVDGHPGALRVRNHGYRTVKLTYFRSGHYSERTRLFVPAHSGRTLRVDYNSLSYFADTAIGPLSDGTVRHVLR